MDNYVMRRDIYGDYLKKDPAACLVNYIALEPTPGRVRDPPLKCVPGESLEGI